MHKINQEEKLRYILVACFVALFNFNIYATLLYSLNAMCQKSGDSLGWTMEICSDDVTTDIALENYKKGLVEAIESVAPDKRGGLDPVKLWEEQAPILKAKMIAKTGQFLAFRDPQTKIIIGSLFIDEISAEFLSEYQIPFIRKLWDLRGFSLDASYKTAKAMVGLLNSIKEAAQEAGAYKFVTSGGNSDEFPINKLLLSLGFKEDNSIKQYCSEFRVGDYRYFSFNIQTKFQDNLDVMCQLYADTVGWCMEVCKDEESIENTLAVYKKELITTGKEMRGDDITEEQLQKLGEAQAIILKNKIEARTGCILAFRDVQTNNIVGSLFLDEVKTQDNKVIWDLRAFGLYTEYKKDLYERNDSVIGILFDVIIGMAKNAGVFKFASSGKIDDEFIMNRILMSQGFKEDLDYSTEDRPAGLVKYFSIILNEGE